MREYYPFHRRYASQAGCEERSGFAGSNREKSKEQRLEEEAPLGLGERHETIRELFAVILYSQGNLLATVPHLAEVPVDPLYHVRPGVAKRARERDQRDAEAQSAFGRSAQVVAT